MDNSMKTVNVDLDTWKKLNQIKIDKNYDSLNVVIKELLARK